MNTKELDTVFQRLRALEAGGKVNPEQRIFDEIFNQLRETQKRVDRLEELKWKIFGAWSAVSIIGALALKIFGK